MADNFDVIVDFSMDEEANRKVLEGATTLEKELKDVEAQAKKTGKAMEDALKANAEHLKSYSTDVLAAGEKVQQSFKEQAEEAAKSARMQGTLFAGEARILSARARAYQIQSAELQRIQSQLIQISQTALVAGTALTAGIFKLANDYVANAPEATRLTLQWKEAQDKLNESTTRIGRVSAQAALPVLQKVAEIAERTASFIETHPELVRAALNIGLITAGLGALGVLVSRGIKMYADILYLQAVPLQQEAASLQLLAAEQMLVAAKLQAEASGVDVLDVGDGLDIPGKGKGLGGKAAGFLTFLGEAAVLLGSFVAGLIAADKAFDFIEKRDVQFQDYITTLKQSLAIDVKNFADRAVGTWQGKLLGITPETGMDWFKKVADGLGLLKDASEETGDALDDLAGSVEASPAFEQILEAYEKYRNDDLKLVQDHYATRQSIIAGALADEAEATRRYQSQVSGLQAQTTQQLTQLQNSYEAQLLQDEQRYKEERANILQDAGEEIAQIEADLQETLRKNALEHKERTNELLADRDALALVKENQRYERENAEARRAANAEIAQLRKDLARRLQELDSQYAAERAERYQEYIARAAEIRQQAAERLKELQLQHAEELRKIREQAAAKLKQEDEAFLAERKRRYQYLIQQIQDLDAGLLGERNLRLMRQQQMIADLNAFLTQYKAGLASLQTAVPKKAEGDYTSGLVMTGEKGYEWIATHKSTVAAENIIGGRLTQDTFIQAMQALRAGSTNYIDQRRLDAPLPKEYLNMMRQAAVEAIAQAMGGR